jgi:hypothetical protein
MAYNFDSDFYPLMTRVDHGGPGILVDFNENSDFEGVFTVTLDSDYVVNLIQEQTTSGSGLDSEQVYNMIREHSAFTDSDLAVLATLRNEVDQLKADRDSDSLKIQFLQTRVDQLQILLDSDQTSLLDIIQRLDSDMISIAELKRNADSDANVIRSLVSTLDSDGRLLEKVLQNEEDIAVLIARHDSDDSDYRYKFDNLSIDANAINDINARLDSDEIAIQHVTTRLKVVENNLDSDRVHTDDRIRIINSRITNNEDSDYYDSDRTVRTIGLNNYGNLADSDVLHAAIVKETGSHLTRIITLENLLGIGVVQAATAVTDSDLNTIEYTQTGSTLSSETKVSWYVYSLGGGEIIKRSFTIGQGASFTSILRSIVYTVNNDSMAMNYFDKFIIDYDSALDNDDTIHFRFKTGFEDMTFDAVVESSADNGRLVVTQ